MASWPAIEWDDGYPTDDSLGAARAFGKSNDVTSQFNDADTFLRHTLKSCAENCCASYQEEEAKDIMDRPCLHGHFSTGGWSGAEEIIALIESQFWLSKRMLQWRRGGHYIFEFAAP